jgi:hypothetical protein
LNQLLAAFFCRHVHQVSFAPKAKGGQVPAAHAARVAGVLQGLKRDALRRCAAAFATEFQTTH